MIDLVLMKREMLQYVQDVRAVRGMGQGLTDHHVLCKVMLVGEWIKRREVEAGTRRIRSEKLREHRYTEGYARSLEGKRVEDKMGNGGKCTRSVWLSESWGKEPKECVVKH